MSSSKPVPSVSHAAQLIEQNQPQNKQQSFGFGAARRLDKLGFANILTPTKEIRVASLARRGFVKAVLSQTQFILRAPLAGAVPALLSSAAISSNVISKVVVSDVDTPVVLISRMGAVAPKRLLKRAVLRNRAKRIMRETARQHPLMAESTDYIVFLREKAPLKNKNGRKQFALDVKASLDRTLEQVKLAKKRGQQAALRTQATNPAEPS